MGPQLIGANISAASANDWRSYQPQPTSVPSNGAGSGGASGGIGNLAAITAGMIGGGTQTAGQISAIQNAGPGVVGNLSKLVSGVGLGYGALNRASGGATANAGFGNTIGALGGGLQFLSGIQRGGVQGYGSAAVGGLRAASSIEGLLGNAGMSSSLGAAAGYIAAPLTTYSAIKNWQSGATAQDALGGLETGAAWGSLFGPEGAVIGAVIGGTVGAISSAFGGGKSSQEAGMAQGVDTSLKGASAAQSQSAINTMSPSQSFQLINGYMNAHDNSAGHSEQIEQVFGKNGVSNMMGQMLPAINAAIAKNPSYARMNETQLYSNVIAPWLKSRGATINASQKDKNGNPEGQNLIDAINSFVSDWRSGNVNSTTAIGNGGETLNMPAYAG